VEEEEEGEEEGAGEGEEQSDQPFVRGTRLTAAQLSGLASRPPITYWGRAMPLNKNSRTLPQQAYSLPTKGQLARIVDNFYKHIPRSKMSYDRCNNCWLGFREWLQQTGLWDGQSVWPETQYDELVRISGIKASRVTARGGRNCDRCVVSTATPRPAEDGQLANKTGICSRWDAPGATYSKTMRVRCASGPGGPAPSRIPTAPQRTRMEQATWRT
jgi:hypothetical protein